MKNTRFRGNLYAPFACVLMVHQDRQSLNLKYVFVNGVAGFVAKR